MIGHLINQHPEEFVEIFIATFIKHHPDLFPVSGSPQEMVIPDGITPLWGFDVACGFDMLQNMYWLRATCFPNQCPSDINLLDEIKNCEGDDLYQEIMSRAKAFGEKIHAALQFWKDEKEAA